MGWGQRHQVQGTGSGRGVAYIWRTSIACPYLAPLAWWCLLDALMRPDAVLSADCHTPPPPTFCVACRPDSRYRDSREATPESLQLHLETRFEQLKVWREWCERCGKVFCRLVTGGGVRLGAAGCRVLPFRGDIGAGTGLAGTLSPGFRSWFAWGVSGCEQGCELDALLRAHPHMPTLRLLHKLKHSLASDTRLKLQAHNTHPTCTCTRL